jgi:hypothetical protein
VAEQRLIFERAVHRARVFASVGGVGHEVLGVLAEIDAYHAAVLNERWPPSAPTGRSRARALVSIALWDTVAAFIEPDQRKRSQFEPSDSARLQVGDEADLPVIGRAIGMFLAGDRSDEVVLSACAETRTLAGVSRSAAQLSSDILLSMYGGDGGGRTSREAGVTVLETAVQIRARAGDPTAVALAARCFLDHPDHWRTVEALHGAVQVASAYGCYGVADELCSFAEEVIASQFTVPAGRDVEVERAIYMLFTHQQRSGTLRRMLQGGAGIDALRSGLAHNQAARRVLEGIHGAVSAGAPAEAPERWTYFLNVRAAEIRLVEIARNPGAAGLPNSLRALDRMLTETARIGARERFQPREFVPLIKSRLQQALLEREYDAAIEHLRELHDLKWPLSRTVPEILAISQPTLRRERAPRSLRDAVDEIASSERESGRQVTADPAAAWRRAQARLASR